MVNILPDMVMRETHDRFKGKLQIEGRIVTNLRYADDIDIILLERQNYTSWWIAYIESAVNTGYH